ncbi:MAG: phage baseplate assembly protein V [Bacteroidota bacterium]
MSIVTATIKSAGSPLPAVYELLSIEVSREINRIPMAEMILIDGNPAKGSFLLSDDDFFEPGKEVEILLRYEGEAGGDESIFKGLVLRHTLESSTTSSTLHVELTDPVFGMTRGRNSAVFTGTDSKVIKALIGKGGATVGSIPDTKIDYPEMVQYYCSDWDFMLSRAEANNLVVGVEDKKVSLYELKISGAAKHKFTYGISDIYSFEMEADASHQYESVQSVAWDIKTQKLSKNSKAAAFPLRQSDLEGSSIAGKFGGKEVLLNSTVPLDVKETQNWADGFMARTSMSLLRGVISVPGFARISLMDVMKLTSFGKRFSGKTLVTGFRHSVDQDGWQTHIQFGLSAAPFSSSPHILDSPAAGLLPGVNGLQIGLVADFEEDKEGKEFRVRVILPGVDPQKGVVWARLSSPDAGKGRGYFFRPEKGDEVIVGFFNDDPRQAVILGSLYSSVNVPPDGAEKMDKENALKGIVSKSGIVMEINDTDQTFSFRTSDNQFILLDEKNKAIMIRDLNENTITLDDKGITLAVADKLTIEAKGDMELKGKNITLNASANVTIKGSKVDVK